MWIVSFFVTLTLKNDLENMLVHIDDIFHLPCVFQVFLLFAFLEEAKIALIACIFLPIFLINNHY